MFSLLLAGGSFISFSSGFAIYVALTLAVFMFVMYKFALPVMSKAIEERESNITGSLEAAEKALARAEEVSTENKKALREAEAKAQAIREEAANEAEKIREDRLSAAREEAEQLISQAKHSIEQEKKAAMEELRKEVSSLAIEAASKILDAEIDEKRNRKIVDGFIEQLNKN